MQFKQVLAVAALSQLVIAAPIAQSSNVLDDMLSGVAGAVSGTLSENGNGNQAGNGNKDNGNGNGNGNGDGAGSGNKIGNFNFKRTGWSMPTVGQAGSDCSISDVLTNTAGVVTGTLSCNGNGNSAGNGNVNNGNNNGNGNGDGAGSKNSIGNFNAKRNDAPSVGQAGSACSISNWLTDAAGVVTGTLSCNGNGNSAGNGNEGNGNSNGNNNGQNAGSVSATNACTVLTTNSK